MKINISFQVLILLFITANYSLAQKNLKSIEILSRNGESHIGKLLCVSDSILVLWESQEEFSWDDFYQYATPYQISDIELLKVKCNIKKSFFKGFSMGALAGGSAVTALLSTYLILKPTSTPAGRYGPMQKVYRSSWIGIWVAIPSGLAGGLTNSIFCFDKKHKIGGSRDAFKKIVPELQRHALFLSMIPLDAFELATQIKKQSSELTNGFDNQSDMEGTTKVLYDLQINPLAIQPSFKSHMTFGIGKTVTPAGQNILDAFVSSNIGHHKKINSPTSYKFCFEINLFNDFRLGFSLNEITQEIIGKNDEYESLIGNSLDLFFEYLPRSNIPFLQNKCEISMGAGLGINSLSIEGNLFWYEDKYKYDFRKNIIGGYLKGSIDFLISRRLTFQLTIDGRLTPKMQIPHISQINSKTGEMKQLNAHSINYSAIDFSMGVRVHL